MIEKKLSIILPVYNEKESLLVMVRLLNSSLKIETEIIIVHDSLKDNSLESAKILANEYDNVKIVHNNYGPGVRHAVKAGIENSRYDIILITAVDEIFPIISIEKNKSVPSSLILGSDLVVHPQKKKSQRMCHLATATCTYCSRLPT